MPPPDARNMRPVRIPDLVFDPKGPDAIMSYPCSRLNLGGVFLALHERLFICEPLQLLGYLIVELP
jgi:hypothetical protein